MVERYKQHSSEWNMLIGFVSCLIIFCSGEYIGETLGKALYYLTH